MQLTPEEYQARLSKYAPMVQPEILGLDHWGLSKDASLQFISDTGNIIFRATVPNGSYCVRIYPDQSISIPEIHGELYWLIDLKRQAGLTVPQPLKTSSNRYVHQIFVPELEKHFYVVLLDWLPGEIVGPSLDLKVTKQLGNLMAQLHNHAATFQLPEDALRDQTDWRPMGDFLADMAPAMLARIRSFLTAEQIEQCQRAARYAAEVLDSVEDAQHFGLNHSDLHSHNCLVHDGQIRLIDFADCQFAPFTSDLAITLSSFDDFADPAQLQNAFLAAYLNKRPLPQGYEKEIEAFRIERRLRLIRWVGTWPDLNHFSTGPSIIETSLNYIQHFV